MTLHETIEQIRQILHALNERTKLTTSREEEKRVEGMIDLLQHKPEE